MPDIKELLEKGKESIQRAKEVLSQIISPDGGNLAGAQNGSGPRPLTNEQIELAKAIFGDSINYDEVRINNSSWLSIANGEISDWDSARPFVLGNTINTVGELPDRTFIHEMMHIHQYQTQGWGYIPEAIGDRNYDYEYDELREYSQNPDYEGKRIDQFGLEQQGEIVMDYFLLSQQVGNSSFAPITLSNGEVVDSSNIDDYMKIYQPYIDEIREQRPMEGLEKEINELGEELIRETGEAIRETASEAYEGGIETAREINEGVGEITREVNQGNTSGVIWEGGEMIFETGRESAEAAIETGGEILEAGAQTGWEIIEGNGEITKEAGEDVIGWVGDKLGL